MTPETEVFRLQPQNSLLVVSNLDAVDNSEGGDAGGRLMDDDDPLDILSGGGLPPMGF